MLLIYCGKLTPRLTYTLDLIFKELLGVEWEATTSLQTFIGTQYPCLNYSRDASLNGLHIEPSSLLYEKGITARKVKKGLPWYGIPTLLLDQEEHFDPLAMSFFLVSRYEEYLDYKPDAHNRFPAEASCLVRLNLLNKPLVNLWALRLLDLLKEKYPDLESTPRTFEYLSTIDIDQAWKYQNKGFFRNAGGGLRDARMGNWEEVWQRLWVILGIEKDSFYNYAWQNEVHQLYGTEVQYFIQVGHRGEFDKNISVRKKSFKRLIRRLDKKYLVGVHPSYSSNERPYLVKKELETLEKIVSHSIQMSRQHFLMHQMPETYVNLMNAGISEDHTMGYSTHPGFRAGIAAPFRFFNLLQNQPTSLQIVPFCLMDITPLHYLSLDIPAAKDLHSDIMWEVKQVGGLMVSLWHNESLSNDGRWKGWRILYEHVLKESLS